MREIKFRAWSETGRCHTCPSESFSLVFDDTGPKIQMWCSDGLVDEFNALHVDQYTGLKDKDGVEIYEGDVVEIECCGKRTRFEVIGPTPHYPAFELKGWDGESNGFYHCFRSAYLIEIVGDIHRNPELLEKNL